MSHWIFDHNWGYYGSIWKHFSRIYFQGMCVCKHKDFHFTLNALLQYLMKLENKKWYYFQQHPLQSVIIFQSMALYKLSYINQCYN